MRIGHERIKYQIILFLKRNYYCKFYHQIFKNKLEMFFFSPIQNMWKGICFKMIFSVLESISQRVPVVWLSWEVNYVVSNY